MMAILGVKAGVKSRCCNNRGADLRVVERNKEAIIGVGGLGFKYCTIGKKGCQLGIHRRGAEFERKSSSGTLSYVRYGSVRHWPDCHPILIDKECVHCADSWPRSKAKQRPTLDVHGMTDYCYPVMQRVCYQNVSGVTA